VLKIAGVVWERLQDIFENVSLAKWILLDDSNEQGRDLGHLCLVVKLLSVLLAAFQVFCLQANQALFDAYRLIAQAEGRRAQDSLDRERLLGQEPCRRLVGMEREKR